MGAGALWGGSSPVARPGRAKHGVCVLRRGAGDVQRSDSVRPRHRLVGRQRSHHFDCASAAPTGYREAGGAGAGAMGRLIARREAWTCETWRVRAAARRRRCSKERPSSARTSTTGMSTTLHLRRCVCRTRRLGGGAVGVEWLIACRTAQVCGTRRVYAAVWRRICSTPVSTWPSRRGTHDSPGVRLPQGGHAGTLGAFSVAFAFGPLERVCYIHAVHVWLCLAQWMS